MQVVNNEEEETERQLKYASECCQYDIKINPDFSFITYYYYGITDIFFGYKDAKNNLEK